LKTEVEARQSRASTSVSTGVYSNNPTIDLCISQNILKQWVIIETIGYWYLAVIFNHHAFGLIMFSGKIQNPEQNNR
jgi:hypothetical protein